MASKCPIRNPQNAHSHWYCPRFFAVDDASFEVLCLRRAREAVAKGSQVAPLWT